MSLREGYKQSEIGVIPEEWEVVKLKNIATFSQGLQVPVEEQILNMEEDHVRFIRIIDYTQKHTDIRYVMNKGERYFALKNDIVMVRYGTPGLIGRGIEGIIANNLFKINLDQNIASNDFFAFLLQDNIVQNKLKSGSASTTMPAINFSTLNGISIPLPSLPEQQKIAEILSTVDQKIDSIDSKIEETKTLKRGLMQRLLSEGIGHSEFKESEIGRIPAGWEVVEQSQVATFYNGRAYKLSEWEEEGTPVIRLQNLTGSGLNYYYSNIELPAHQYCYKGDLLYMWSATFGPVWWQGDKAIFHYHIWKIDTQADRLDKNFLFYLLDQITTRMKKQSHGSTMIHVTKGGMEKLKIQLPPLDEQKQIAEILSTTDRKLESLRAKKAAFETLKKGLMQKLLSGEVRVN